MSELVKLRLIRYLKFPTQRSYIDAPNGTVHFFYIGNDMPELPLAICSTFGPLGKGELRERETESAPKNHNFLVVVGGGCVVVFRLNRKNILAYSIQNSIRTPSRSYIIQSGMLYYYELDAFSVSLVHHHLLGRPNV